MGFPVFNRSCGQNVFHWILQASEAVRQERYVAREMAYRILLAKKEIEAAHGKLTQKKRQEEGQGSGQASSVKEAKTYRAGEKTLVEKTPRKIK